MQHTTLAMLFAGLALTSAACGEKKERSPDVTSATSATPTEGVATPTTPTEVPGRVAFSLDDNDKFVYIPRPSSAEKRTAITSFVAKRARDRATWESIDIELADGSSKHLTEISTEASYSFGQREPAGVDLIVATPSGEERERVGPVAKLRLRTKSFGPAPKNIDGKAVLALQIAGESSELTPSALEGRERRPLPDDQKLEAWPLLELLPESAAGIESGELIVQAEKGERRFDLATLRQGEIHLFLRHNKRGELRLKGFRDGKSDDESSMRDVSLVILRPR